MYQQCQLSIYSKKEWLFTKRLCFICSQTQLVTRKQLFQLPQELFFAAKKIDPGLASIPIQSQQDLKNIYLMFNSLIYRCRFNSKNIELTFNKSRNQLRSKKHLKDIQSKCKNKIKRFLQLIKQPEQEQQHWKTVLNHKNIFEHVIKAEIFLKGLLDNNFDLIKQGAAHLKNQSLPLQLQINICILLIDVISLISSIKFYFLPFAQEQNNSNKVQAEQKKIFDEALQSIEDESIKILRKLDKKRFVKTIQRIVDEMKDNRKYKLWLSIKNVQQTYLMDQNGFYKKKFTSTTISQLKLYWAQIYNEYFSQAIEPCERNISLSSVFADYKPMFNFYLLQAMKNPQKIDKVTDYLELIRTVWLKIDALSASNIFWQQLSLASTKLTLPSEFIKQSKQLIIEIANNIIIQFEHHKNQDYLTKIKNMAFEISNSLLLLQPEQDLVQSYILKSEKKLRFLLTQRNVLNQTFEQIRRLVVNVQQKDLFSVIKRVTERMKIDLKNTKYCMNSKYQEETIKILYQIYTEHHHIISELKYFYILSRCFTNNQPNLTELQECKSFYHRQRQVFISNQMKFQSKAINNLGFGLLDAVKIVTFELIMNIKLDKHSNQLEMLKSLLHKLLKIYQLKRLKDKKNSGDQQISEQQHTSILLLKRISSSQITLANLQISQEQINEIEVEANKENTFTMNFLKKIFHLRVEIINQNVMIIRQKEKPFKQEYIDLRNKVYLFTVRNETDQILIDDVKKLASIQYDFTMKNYYEAWTDLRKLKDIDGVNKILEMIWDGKRNLLKLFITILLKYREPIFQQSIRKRDLQESDIQALIQQSLEGEHKNTSKLEENTRLNLKQAIRVLDNFQKVAQLKRQIISQDQKLNNIEEIKNYKTIPEDVRFKQLEGKLEIHSILKNQTLIMRKYILKLQREQIDEVYKKLRKLSQLNRSISLQINKVSSVITMKVDEVQNVFESYPKLVKFLVQSYLEIIQFCSKNLHFNLYPLLLHNHIKIYKKNNSNIYLKLNPFEGILLNIILSHESLKQTNYFKYPQYPFIQFSNQLAKKFEKDKIYSDKAKNTQYYGFIHLIEQIKALSMEIEPGNVRETVAKILKCPYFWSSTDKLFEIVEFKERYHSLINIEQSRRKSNEVVRQSLNQQQKQLFTYTPVEKKHPRYYVGYGYSKTTQIYFSIQGILERQAFQEDIGNSKGQNNQKYKYHGFNWAKDKAQIKRLIQMISERQRKKGSNRSSFYQKTFNSFQNLVRNLRNLAVHYIYDNENKKEIDLQEKINIFQRSFPKLFVFLYRWRPFLGKDFLFEIKIEKIQFLKELFCNQDNMDIIERLSQIKQLQAYNIRNNSNKTYLLDFFHYNFAKINGCQPCKILCNSLRKQDSFWAFLEDVKREGFKEERDRAYNLLFWQHEAKGCNGFQNILLPYYNVSRRHIFTTEQFAQVQSSLTIMQIQKERLQKKIQKKLESIQKNGQQAIEEESEHQSEECNDIQNRGHESIQRRFNKLSINQLQKLNKSLAKLDYVCKYFIYELEMEFPYLFHDLRKQRYQWDERAWEYPQKE